MPIRLRAPKNDNIRSIRLLLLEEAAPCILRRVICTILKGHCVLHSWCDNLCDGENTMMKCAGSTLESSRTSRRSLLAQGIEFFLFVVSPVSTKE